MRLLSINSDSKTIKGLAYGWLTAICYLAPARLAILASHAVKTVCAFATAECTAVCLNTAGLGGVYKSIQEARIKKTRLWLEDPAAFLEKLRGELFALERAAKKKSLKPAARLNGLSDIRFEKTGIFDEFKKIQFYDYSKYPSNLIPEIASNYHITYSYTGLEISRTFAGAWLERGYNVAAVFRGGLPATFLGHKVIDGDKSDLRFLDPKRVIVGLKAKGKARLGVSSFVTDVVNGVAVIRDPAAVAESRTVPAEKPTAIKTNWPVAAYDSPMTAKLEGKALQAYLVERFGRF